MRPPTQQTPACQRHTGPTTRTNKHARNNATAHAKHKHTTAQARHKHSTSTRRAQDQHERTTAHDAHKHSTSTRGAQHKHTDGRTDGRAGEQRVRPAPCPPTTPSVHGPRRALEVQSVGTGRTGQTGRGAQAHQKIHKHKHASTITRQHEHDEHKHTGTSTRAQAHKHKHTSTAGIVRDDSPWRSRCWN